LYGANQTATYIKPGKRAVMYMDVRESILIFPNILRSDF